MVEDNPREVGHEMDNLNIVYGDESLPHLYENSRISADQLPGQSGKNLLSNHRKLIEFIPADCVYYML